MNKLLTNFNGGVGLDLDDIRYEQDAVRDALNGILSGFGYDIATNTIKASDSFIISGCTITPVFGIYIISAGYIAFKGEVLKVDAHAVVAAGVGVVNYWDVEVTYDSNGAENTEAGAPINQYEVRKGKVGIGVAPANYMPMYASRLATKVFDLINALNYFAPQGVPAIAFVGDTGNPAFMTGWANATAPVNKLGYRKDPFGRVSIQGFFTAAAFTFMSTGPIFTLPVGFRPSVGNEKFIAVNAYFVTAGAVKPCNIQIDSAGLVILDILPSGIVAFPQQVQVNIDISFNP